MNFSARWMVDNVESGGEQLLFCYLILFTLSPLFSLSFLYLSSIWTLVVLQCSSAFFAIAASRIKQPKKREIDASLNKTENWSKFTKRYQTRWERKNQELLLSKEEKKENDETIFIFIRFKPIRIAKWIFSLFWKRPCGLPIEIEFVRIPEPSSSFDDSKALQVKLYKSDIFRNIEFPHHEKPHLKQIHSPKALPTKINNKNKKTKHRKNQTHYTDLGESTNFEMFWNTKSQKTKKPKSFLCHFFNRILLVYRLIHSDWLSWTHFIFIFNERSGKKIYTHEEMRTSGWLNFI